MSFETSALSILAFVALGLMVVVTGGIGYLTTIEWRDRRRRQQEENQQRKQQRRR